jgi:hypothetical protein
MSVAASILEVMNKANGELGQKSISAADLVNPDAKSNAGKLAREYDNERTALLRAFPYEFASEELPLPMVDVNGCVIRLAGTVAVNGAFTYADSIFTHETADVEISGGSGAWVIGNAAGTEEYYTSTAEVSDPWSVAFWVLGADATGTALPRIYPGKPRKYAFLYKKPADCLHVFGVVNQASNQVDDRIRFRGLHNEYIGCDVECAVFQYAWNNEDVSEFDSLFIDYFAKALAFLLYVDIKGSDKGIQSLAQKVGAAKYYAQNVDANEQYEEASKVQGRNYLDLP